MMTRKDFEALAALIKEIDSDHADESRKVDVYTVWSMLADFCETRNNAFNRARFYKASLETNEEG